MQDVTVDELLAPISTEAPAGSDLRYTTFYEEIMEARRSDDAVALGDWRHDVKAADWNKVIKLCVAALSTKSKDLQIAVWLCESLIVVDGFPGLDAGLRLLKELMGRYWDCFYPVSGDEDLEYRAAPLDFLNEKVATQLKRIPLTDPLVTPGYSCLKWEESRRVGYEAETRNSYGEVEEEWKQRRDARISEGGLTAEEFDAAVEKSRGTFSEQLLESLKRCEESLQGLEWGVEAKWFPAPAPSLAALGAAMNSCQMLARKCYGVESPPQANEPEAKGSEVQGTEEKETAEVAPPALRQPDGIAGVSRPGAAQQQESSLWGEGLALLEAGHLEQALTMLLYTSNSCESTRDRNRIRLLMVKLCLKAGRGDLARPIVEELHDMIEELKLERWESPVWIAEVLHAYYQCLQAGELPDEDLTLSRVLFKRICSLDVTKGIPYRI
ncbi:type VI secretion system ImpA-related domain protein [Citrifermentans bemidjiense Bem]|uniref:Type VI secretion system ImpA-related domain protein n=1 Tax=Citrifermentans bemidjiense (strain ATCC BAA-1014 / DSM 16622 / JCM 12645 / Bem) TaxID=404380 RepID=B5E877_CITBB|nr:type VI secretion system protein TssA [Citrifermentans bemidjiense]ACH40046.1 type VI secretion system ImpA-related domain protein [Citrifermentans bemidjiense Bem]